MYPAREMPHEVKKRKHKYLMQGTIIKPVVLLDTLV